MELQWLNVLGGLAALVSTLIWLPQARTTWQGRNDPEFLRGISVGTLSLALLNAMLWAIYAFASGAFWAGVPSFVNAPIIAWSFLLIHRARKKSVVGLGEKL